MLIVRVQLDAAEYMQIIKGSGLVPAATTTATFSDVIIMVGGLELVLCQNVGYFYSNQCRRGKSDRNSGAQDYALTGALCRWTSFLGMPQSMRVWKT